MKKFLVLFAFFFLITGVSAKTYNERYTLYLDGVEQTYSYGWTSNIYSLSAGAAVSRVFTLNKNTVPKNNVSSIFIPVEIVNRSSNSNNITCTSNGTFNQSLGYYAGQGLITSNPSGNNSYSGQITCHDDSQANFEQNLLYRIYFTTTSGSVYCNFVSTNDYGSGFICFPPSSSDYITRLGDLTFGIKNLDNYLNMNVVVNFKSYWVLITDDSKVINDSVNDVNDSVNDVNNSVNDVNDSLNNDDVTGGSTEASGFINNDVFSDSTGLSAVISAPLNFINSLTSKSCNSITLDIPFFKNNTKITIPCLSSIYVKALGSNLYNTLSMVINGILCYRLCIEIFYIIKGAKDPDSDKVEVLDL